MPRPSREPNRKAVEHWLGGGIELVRELARRAGLPDGDWWVLPTARDFAVRLAWMRLSASLSRDGTKPSAAERRAAEMIGVDCASMQAARNRDRKRARLARIQARKTPDKMSATRVA